MRAETFALRTASKPLFALASVLLACGGQVWADPIDVGHIVQANGNEIEHTTVVVRRQSDGQIWLSNAARTQQRFSPASTSKIPHTLIALETGLVDLDTLFEWDGIPRSSRVWNQDHAIASAFENSVVWVFQDIAQAVGQTAMSEHLTMFEYGNMSVGPIDHLTTYWLDDTLQISAAEQVEFLTSLAFEQLPLSVDTYAAARDIMLSAESATWQMRPKTGWRFSEDDMDIGWFVGWLECSSETYVFALNMDMPDTRYLSRRREITYAVLRDIGAFDCN